MYVEVIILLFMFVGLIVGLGTGHPIAFVLGGIGVMAGLIGWGPEVFTIFTNTIFGTMSNYTLVAIPLFTFMAYLLSSSNIADGLFEYMRYLFGPVPGGVAISIILVSTLFAATTGIVGASIVTMGVLGMPVLLKYGYDKKLSAGVIASGGTLGILIPPSIMLIVLGAQAQVSVGKLFLAAIAPGLLLSASYLIYILIVTLRNPKLGPPLSKEEAQQMPVKKRIVGSIIYLLPTLLLIVIVLGTIFTGIATPTESAAVGVVLAIILTLVYRKFSWQMLAESIYQTARITAMTLIIMIGASIFTAMFLALNGDVLVQNMVQSLGIGKWGVIVLMLVTAFVLGMFIDWIGIVMILLPIFLPLLQYYEFNLLWAMTVLAVLLQTSFLTPPFGFALFYLKGVVPPEVTMTDIYRGMVPFIVIMLIVTALVIVIPDLILWLPSLSNL